jgi:hypothetical protein
LTQTFYAQTYLSVHPTATPSDASYCTDHYTYA